MKILYLSLKKEWYEMIERGDKREEYRENTRYWKTRLIDTVIYDEGDEETESPVFIFFKDYDAVCFSYGYTRRRMLWECKGIDFGRGRPEWGAPDHKTFIIKLGNRLNDERLVKISPNGENGATKKGCRLSTTTRPTRVSKRISGSGSRCRSRTNTACGSNRT